MIPLTLTAAAVFLLALAAPAAASTPPDSGPQESRPLGEDYYHGPTVTPERTLVSAGEWTRIYDPSDGEDEAWYINDHTIFQGADGTWHLIGITHAEPADPLDEKHLAHATAPTLLGPWTKQDDAMEADPFRGETQLWAPHVVEVDGTFEMFYCGGGLDNAEYGIFRASTDDPNGEWTRFADNPLFRDGFDARDPMVVRVGDEWVLYYTATSEPTGGNHTVMYRTSPDLVTWSARQTAFTDADSGTWGGGTESPFVVQRGDWWYLFIGPRGHYVGTDVFRSQDPLDFEGAELVGHIDAHAAEVIIDGDDWYISDSGWGRGGVYLAPLIWSDDA